MGNVRDKNIKKFSKQLIEEYPDKVSTDFNINKQLLKDLKCINSKIVRNRVAGYIVQCLKTKDNTYEN